LDGKLIPNTPRWLGGAGGLFKMQLIDACNIDDSAAAGKIGRTNNHASFIEALGRIHRHSLERPSARFQTRSFGLFFNGM